MSPQNGRNGTDDRFERGLAIRKEVVGEVKQKGLMGYLQRQAKEAEQRRAGATEVRSETDPTPSSSRIE